MESNQPIISIESKLSGNTKRDNQIIESNKYNDNVSKSKMPISIPSHPVYKTGQAKKLEAIGQLNLSYDLSFLPFLFKLVFSAILLQQVFLI